MHQAALADAERAHQNYLIHCMGCHGEAGLGLEGQVPSFKNTLARISVSPIHPSGSMPAIVVPKTRVPTAVRAAIAPPGDAVSVATPRAPNATASRISTLPSRETLQICRSSLLARGIANDPSGSIAPIA